MGGISRGPLDLKGRGSYLAIGMGATRMGLKKILIYRVQGTSPDATTDAEQENNEVKK